MQAVRGPLMPLTLRGQYVGPGPEPGGWPRPGPKPNICADPPSLDMAALATSHDTQEEEQVGARARARARARACMGDSGRDAWGGWGQD